MVQMRFLLSLVLAGLLTSCGGSDDDGAIDRSRLGTSPVQPPTIESFTVIGSFTHIYPDPVPIYATLFGGKFTLVWTTTARSGNLVRAYVSEDNQLERTADDDIQFFSMTCGDAFDCNEAGDGSQLCFFTTGNHLKCGNNTIGTDITDFLTGIPMDTYIIFEACTGKMTPIECSIHAVLVEFG